MKFLSLLLLLTWPLCTVAQDTTAPASLAETRDPVITNFKDWTLQCLPPEGEQPETCAMVQELRVKSGKRLLALQITETGTVVRQDGPSLVAVFSLPLGVYLPSGVIMEIEGKPPLKLEYERCDRGGCYAGVVLGEILTTALREGVEGKVRFNNLNGRTISATISLKGFTAAYNALVNKI